ncbi:MAG: DUF5117 domain-containing protein [Rubrivivax sp.]|nr:MAG: DUF5117 domain-containing protein [Rubrivivax sp.]
MTMPRFGRCLPLALSLTLLSGCTSLQQFIVPVTVGGSGATTGVGSGGTGGTQMLPVVPLSSALGTPPAFDTVVKGAEKSEGLFTTWKRQDKIWIELAPKDFGRALFLSPRLSTGLGEAGFFGGLLASRFAQIGRPQWVEFRRLNQQIQLVAVNAAYTAQANTPQALAVQAAFSPSLLASVPASSAPHPSRGTVLVEISSLLTGDVLGLGLQLQRAFRQSYGLDARNTAISRTRSTPMGIVIDVQQHFVTSSIASASSGGGQQPGVPSALPDPRSLFLTVQYTLTPLPTQPMPSRPADARVGFFATTVADFTDDLARTPRQRFVNRWRLEKKDPQAAVSAPVRPLVFWLDSSIPTDYRGVIQEGILAWNKAFEAIGFRGAIQVRQSGSDAPLDLVGNGQAVVRWMTNSQPSFGAIGPTHVDPRTGEILTADIALESLSSRAIRAQRSQILTQAAPHGHSDGHDHDRCLMADLGAEQLGYGLGLMAAGGELPPDSAEVRQFVLAYLRDTTMHEVGHALGLRHNFKASRWRPNADLNRLDLTTREGNSASVMDYTPINLNLPGQPAGAPFQTTLGPYDVWAIEYGYKPLEGTAAQQKDALLRLAERSADPAWADALAYGTDEDDALGLDPQALTFDLGRDPITFARTRIAIARDLMARQATVMLGREEDATLPRRRVGYALRDMARVSTVLTRQIGGLVTRRDAPGSGRDVLDPLPAATQRQALDVLIDEYLSPSALPLPPALQRRMAPDYFERSESRGDSIGTDFSVADQLAVLRRGVLDALMDDELAERVLDNIDKTRDRDPQPLTVRELHNRLREAIWPAAPSSAAPARGARTRATRALPADAAAWQRNLQRDYVNRLSAAVVRGGTRADARAQVRQQARLLVDQLSKVPRTNPTGRATPTPDIAAEAHRRDCLDTLQRALDASVIRSTP